MFCRLLQIESSDTKNERKETENSDSDIDRQRIISKTLPPNLNPKFAFQQFSGLDESTETKLRFGEVSTSGGSQFLSVPEKNIDYNSDDGLDQD